MSSIIVVGIIMLISTYIGIYFRAYYRERNAFFVDILGLAKHINEKIKSTHDLIPKIIEKYEPNSKTLSSIWNNLGYKNFDYSTVFDNKYTKDERKILINYFMKLGKSDFETEIKKSDEFISKLNSICDKTKSDVKEKGELIFKLAIMAGLAVSILII